MPDTAIATGKTNIPQEGVGVCGATGMLMQAVNATKPPAPQPQVGGTAATQSAASSSVKAQK